MKTYLNINSIQDKSIPGSKLEESYVSQENGKGLSTNDFTDVLKNKLLSLNNYDDSELNEKLLKLEQNLNSILGEGSTEAIENFNEIISFLSGIEDSESLDNIIAAIELQISNKQDKINDLQKIREGASKGETALQDIPEGYITEDELENKGYLTEHQDITPEILQNENEVAIKVGNNTSGYATINYSKFSNDLTGRIEATPEEFTFRPSAADKSIRDESALIKKIKGNTIVWNQLAYKTKVYNHGGITYTFGENDVVTANGTLTGESSRFGWVPLQKNHYYYHRVEVIDMGECSEIWVGNINEYYGRRIFNSIGIYERIVKRNTTTNSIIGIIRANDTDVNVTGLTARYQCFDLTLIYGEGNEPTTVDEFKVLFPNDYYDYNDGELVSMTSNRLFTNGFNQWDEQWELGYLKSDGSTAGYVQNYIRAKNYIPVIGGAVYNANVPNGVSDANLYAVDENYNLIKQIYPWANTQFHIPDGAKYIRFYMNYGSEVYNNNININLSHTGVRNGEYEPYWDATKDLSIIQKYFPNGMRSAGSICDEISFDESAQKWIAIQRVGSVDLGNSDIKYDSTRTAFYLRLYNSKTLGKAICPKFTLHNVSATNLSDGEMSLHSTYYLNSVIFKATSYTDATSFKEALSGMMLHYELEEPIITTIEEPVDLSYKVGDFGIEKMLSDSFSAPFKADIIYQFNATDRVRENSTNISKLGKKHNLLESEVNNHEGQINEFNNRLSKAETLIRKVEDGSVVVENTLSALDETSNKPVNSGAVATAIEQSMSFTAKDLVNQGFLNAIIVNYARPATIITSADTLSTNPILVGKKIKGRGWFGGNASTACKIWFLDMNKNIFAQWFSSISGVQDIDVDVPEGAVYFIATTLASYASYFCITTDTRPILEDSSVIAQMNASSLDAFIDEGAVKVSQYYTSATYADIYVENIPNKKSIYIKVDYPSRIGIEVKNLENEVIASGYNGSWLLLDGDRITNNTVTVRDISTAISSPRAYTISFRESFVQTHLDLRGKKILFFGDSISYFKYPSLGWIDHFALLTGAECYNVAIGGAQIRQRMSTSESPTSEFMAYAALDIFSMVKAVVEQNFSVQDAAVTFLDRYESQISTLKSVNLAEISSIVIFAGGNDWYNGSDYWGWEDHNSVNTVKTVGAINEALRLINSTYPNIQVVWVTPTVRWIANSVDERTSENWGDNYERNGLTIKQWVDKLKEQVKRHKIPIYDAYNELGWNQYNFSNFYLDTDGVHPYKGFEWLANKIANWFASQRAF